MVWDQHHAADASQGMGQVVISGGAGKTMKQNYTGPQLSKSTIRPQDFSIQMAAMADDI